MKQKYSDEQIKEDIKSFFQNPDHWVYLYGKADDCNPDSPYHRKQLEVLFEDRYFHWVTHRVVNDLIDENFLKEEVRRTKTGTPESVSFVYRKDIRYQRRAIKKRLKLIERYSDSVVSKALGDWGEHLSEFMFTRLGFKILARHTNEFTGKKWTETNHDLDFIVEKDGIFYGVEVKNTLPYMERDEFDIKLKICDHLGLVPLWILRNAPGNQFKEMKDSGGFILKLKSQIYPIGFNDLVRDIWNTMRLPVTIWDRIPEKLENLVKRFHQSKIEKL